MRYLLIVPVVLALAGCDTSSQSQRTLGGAAIGAGSGALVGSALNGGRGAAVGAIAGGAAGALIGRATTPNDCIYRDRTGRKFTGPCP
jgi:uncharacterized protein YcfJ